MHKRILITHIYYADESEQFFNVYYELDGTEKSLTISKRSVEDLFKEDLDDIYSSNGAFLNNLSDKKLLNLLYEV